MIKKVRTPVAIAALVALSACGTSNKQLPQTVLLYGSNGAPAGCHTEAQCIDWLNAHPNCIDYGRYGVCFTTAEVAQYRQQQQRNTQPTPAQQTQVQRTQPQYSQPQQTGQTYYPSYSGYSYSSGGSSSRIDELEERIEELEDQIMMMELDRDD